MAKKRQLNREAVITRAALLADEAGSVTAVSLTELARALNIRTPSLYNHIDGLEDLQAGLTLFALRQLIVDLRRASLGLVGQEAIMALADAYHRFAQTHPGLYPLTIRAPEPEEAELMALAQELVQMLLLIMASLGLQGEEAIHAIRGLRAILHGFVSLEAAEGFKMDLDSEESFHRLLTSYLAGLAPEL